MAVDLFNFVPNLIAEVNAPGTDDFANASAKEWNTRLLNGFWEAKLDGFILTYTADDVTGAVTPITGTTDMPRDLVQLVVLYASFAVIRNTLRNIRTMFRSAAGPVSFETQQSANLLVALMKDIQERRNILLRRLSDVGTVPTYYIDAVATRDLNLTNNLISWVDSGAGSMELPGYRS